MAPRATGHLLLPGHGAESSCVAAAARGEEDGEEAGDEPQDVRREGERPGGPGSRRRRHGVGAGHGGDEHEHEPDSGPRPWRIPQSDRTRR